jgi:hypothetical protein
MSAHIAQSNLFGGSQPFTDHSTHAKNFSTISKEDKNVLMPNANIRVIEKNPMNITIYNIRSLDEVSTKENT